MRKTHISSVFLLLVIMGGLLAIAARPTANNRLPAAQPQATIDAAVRAGLTQTAEAAAIDPAATAAFEATVQAAIDATVAALNTAPPTATDQPTATTDPLASLPDLQTAVIFSPPSGDVQSADVQAGLAASGGSNGIAYVWDVMTGSVQYALAHETTVTSVRFHPTAPELISADANGRVYRWSLENGDSLPVAPQPEMPGPAIITSVAADGSQFGVYNPEAARFSSWSYADVAPVDVRETVGFTIADYAADVLAYADVSDPTTLQVDVAGTTYGYSQPEGATVEVVALDDAAQRVVVTTDAGENLILSRTLDEVLLTYPQRGRGLSAFSPDGAVLADVTDDGELVLMDSATGEVLVTFDGHNAAGIRAVYSADAQTLLTFAEDNTVRSWRSNVTGDPLTVVAEAPPPDPTQPTPLPAGFPPITQAEVQVAEQVFEGGRMFWVQPVNQLWVMLVDDEGSGRWLVYPDTFDEETDDVFDPTIGPPEGLLQPERGFGKLWRENPEVQDALGWALTPEFGYVSEYRYIPGGETVDGSYQPGPGYHVLYSLNGEAFRFDEVDGSWQLGE